MAIHQRLVRQGEHSHPRRASQAQMSELGVFIGNRESLEKG
jgi:hypothetical protein